MEDACEPRQTLGGIREGCLSQHSGMTREPKMAHFEGEEEDKHKEKTFGMEVDIHVALPAACESSGKYTVTL